jgi:acyl-CoA thioesterase
MGDLAVDARVVGANGCYRARLSPQWDAWGPNGGYIAAVSLNAARAHGSLPRVASLSCHFLSVARFAEVELEVETLRAATRAEALRVAMTQEGRPVAHALVWLTAETVEGLVHDVAQMPDTPRPGELRSIDERVSEDAPAPLPMWNNIDFKPLAWYEDVENKPLTEPYAGGWYRFPAHTTDDTARQLVLLDVMAYSAAWQAHPANSGYIAPNLDLNAQFHRGDPDGQWLFAEGFADVAEGGLVGYRTRVWSSAGRLLSSGSGQLICRPAP